MNNNPNIWIEKLPYPTENSHKYNRGQVVVLGGRDMTGAACLSADAAAKIGAGLVTIISPNDIKNGDYDPVTVYRCFKPYIIVKNDVVLEEFVVQAKVKGVVCSVIGPGLGNKDYNFIRNTILSLLDDGVTMVIDADGINAFEGHISSFFARNNKYVILTPHEGEFKKIFPDLASLLNTDREKAVKEASDRLNAVIVLKGYETIIASKGQEIVVNNNASPYLATAGSGDVLSGMIAGLTCQGMSAFDAACAGVWIHARASKMIMAGLVASDLIDFFPKVLKEMLGINEKLG